ncbi:tetratricopeptide repeat protein [Candidatus Synchoanobacter obligatus]|uniref:Sel1 repeat family protein n=1 Tax=Candidatus Synchoanobacter obligatus TaxID=2919597 RepID=A0ABT1L4E9_9GAMM|nr:tetratricopeptide repeat protein [Candidatus Synchoanobacter obligatus]MCP8352047.1 sel1 repeat family protein [Candidatus Synchoanobacter obligatus]
MQDELKMRFEYYFCSKTTPQNIDVAHVCLQKITDPIFRSKWQQFVCDMPHILNVRAKWNKGDDAELFPLLKGLSTKYIYGEIQFKLAVLYELGRGVAKDVDVALRHYLLAANLGHGGAMVNIALIYAQGKVGIQESMTAANLWFDKALRLEHPYVYFQMGLLYWHGTGVQKNPSYALELVNKSAAKEFKMAKDFLSSLPVDHRGLEDKPSSCHDPFGLLEKKRV